MGAAATATTNPLLLGLVLAVVGLVVAAGRPAGPHHPFRAYLVLALVVIAIRVGFRLLFGGGLGTHVLFALPRLPLPEWAAGVTVGGPVTVEAMVASLADGMRLATIVVCVGAANSLADPRRLLRSLPRALYDVGAAAAVALAVAPQVVESIARVRRARRLRGRPATGLRSVRSLLAPVLEDALSRSLALAAAMDSRGYGRLGPTPRSRRRLGAGFALTGMAAVCGGGFGLVNGAFDQRVALGALLAGLAAGGVALAVAGGTVGRTVYRPDRWGLREWLVAASGLAAATAVWATGSASPSALVVSVQPLAWPAFPAFAAAGLIAAAIPFWVVPSSAGTGGRAPLHPVERAAS